MKKVTILILFIVCTLTGYANHDKGFTITWEKIGSRYTFTVVHLVECGTGSALSLPVLFVNTNASIGVFPVRRVKSEFLADSCIGGVSNNCGTSSIGSGATLRHTYVNDTVALTGPIPATGWWFSVDNCCRPAYTNLNIPVNSQYIFGLSYMYPDGFNLPSAQPSMDKPIVYNSSDTNSFYVGLNQPQGDSLHFELVGLLNGGNGSTPPFTSINFKLGYSATAPLPSATQNPLNTGLSINSQTGLMKFYSATTGNFAVNVEVTGFKKGILKYKIYKEMDIYILNNANTSGQPKLNATALNAKSNLTKIASNHYKVKAEYLDTIKLQFEAKDVELNTDGNSQQIAFAILQGDTNCISPICAKFKPVAPQNSFVSDSVNTVTFEAFVGNGTYAEENYFLQWQDNTCFPPRKKFIELDVELSPIGSIYTNKTNYSICPHDTVYPEILGDVSNLVWSPTHFLTGINTANPFIFTDSTRTYTVKDLNTGDSILIQIEMLNSSLTPVLDSNNNYLTCTNASLFDSLTWIYNGLILENNTDSILALATGNYWVEGHLAGCNTFSNIIVVSSATQVNLNLANGSSTPGNGPGVYSFDVTLISTSNFLDTLIMVIPNNGSGKRPFQFTLTLLNNGNILSSDTALFMKGPFVYFAPQVPVQQNKVYQILLETDFPFLSLYVPQAFPFTEANNIFEINGPAHYKANSASTPDTLTGVPYTSILLSSGIGISENELAFKIYPNPLNLNAGQQSLNIVLNGKANIEILDLNGKLMLEEVVYSTKQLEITDLKTGLYLIKITNNKGVKVEKLLVN